VREVVGIVRAYAYMHRHSGSQLLMVTPAEARRALGLPATASKSQVKRMVSKLTGWEERAMSTHAADAAAVAIAAHKVLFAGAGRKPRAR
jgi:Holliday junction resolvasome RuvABC endonuclease subunit